MDKDEIKKVLGKSAAELIHSGMKVGLGTGTTAHYFIENLIERCKQGLKISAAASSKKSYEQAKKGGIPLLDINEATTLDIYVDGADEVDPMKRMIKGKGGALVREKIVASMSREMVVIIDEGKLVAELGQGPLPVEVIPFACHSTQHILEKIGFFGSFRKISDGTFFITDNGNYILDIVLPSPRKTPEQDHELIRSIPGVVDTGFFFHLAGRVIVGFFDGQIVVRP